MRLVIRDTPEDAGVWAANLVVDRLRTFNPTAEKPFVLGLPTGSTPLTVYRELVRQYKAGLVCVFLCLSGRSSMLTCLGVVCQCRDLQHGMCRWRAPP